MDERHAVAIVGVACRFPGGSDLDEFWKTLEEGDCRMEEMRKDRWSLDAFYDPNKDAPGKTYAKHAALIDDWNMWDNAFFGVNTAEAERMDPQHKIALECVYKAIENAGISVDDLWGSNTSVYMGQMNDDMSRMSELELSTVSSYHSTGISRSLLSNRVSYIYNLHGPSLTVDTACSAGLVSVHQGILSILAGESDSAICGGVSIIHSPTPFVTLSKARMASEKGKCHAFSNQADGYARGEGCGVVILKSIKKAKEDGDNIWGYIASGINQDGHTVTPITAPSGIMQEKLLRQMYNRINLDPKQIQYIEAHGTGTRAGDPVEIGSLGRVIGAAHDKSDPCWVGSVKTNIGHTESAAGLAGIIKVLLMMKYGKIVPSLHFDVPNPNIDFKLANLAVPTDVVPWPKDTRGSRIACINSFGFGGTNAHAVLMQLDAGQIKSKTRELCDHIFNIVACSAKSKDALKQSLVDLLAGIKSPAIKTPLLPLSFTSTARRSHFNWRVAFPVRDTSTLTEQVEKRIESLDQVIPSTNKDDVVFVFNGMGTHWAGMGTQLMQCERVFRGKMEEIDCIIQQQEGWSVLTAIRSGRDFSDPAIGQPAIFAVQVSLATLWKSWGVHPRVVIGHSVGEVASAHVAGKLTLTDAVKVVCARGKLLSQVTGGSMLVIGNMAIPDVQLHISQSGGKVEIAAQNSPLNCTISGDEDHIAAIHDQLIILKEKENPRLFLKQIPVRVAFHSHHIDSIVQPLGKYLERISEASVSSETTIISTVTGMVASKGDFTTSEYWQKNIRQQVLFCQGLQTISGIVNDAVFIEIGPKPALGRNINETLLNQTSTIIPSMKANEESSTIIKSLAAMYNCGASINWKSFWGKPNLEMTTLPRYQYQKKKLYFEPETVAKWRLGQAGKIETVPQDMQAGYLQPDTEWSWVCKIDKGSTPFVYDHRRDGKAIIPGAMYAELGLSACIASTSNMKQVKKCITSVALINAYYLHHENMEAKMNVLVDHQPEMPPNFFRFFIKGNSMLLAKGNVQFLAEENRNEVVAINAIKERCPEYFTAADTYDILETHKFTYGNTMRAIKNGVRNKMECLVGIELPVHISQEKRGVIIHPAILDSCLQLTAMMFYNEDGETYLGVPVAINELVIKGDPRDAEWIYMNVAYQSTAQTEFAAYILDCDGNVLVKASRIVIKTIDKILLQNPSDLCLIQSWLPVELKNEGKQADDHADKMTKTGEIYHFYANSDFNRYISTKLGSDITSIAKTDMAHDPLTVSDLQAYFLNRNPAAILFSLGIPPGTEAQFTENDLEASETCCLSLLNICKYCSTLQSKKRIPVFVLTKHVYLHAAQAPWSQLPNLPRLNMKCCLVGSALWGLTRSAVREGLRIISVDMVHCNEAEINLLSTLVSSGPPSYFEWVFAHGSSYRNEILPLMGQVAKQRRALTIRQDDVMQIVSKHVHGAPVLHQDVMEVTQQDTQRQVQVTRVRLQTDSWFATQSQAGLSNGSVINDEGLPLTAIDYTVKVVHMTKNDEFFGCLPIPLAEVAHVDSKLLVPVSLLPSQIPMLSLWLVSWDVLKNHSEKSKHITIHNLSTWNMLETCMRSVAHARKCIVEEKPAVVTPVAIVLADKSRFTPTMLRHILLTSRKAVVITSDEDLRVACRISLKENVLNKVKFYGHVDIFEPHHLVKLVPIFKKWLIKVSMSELKVPCKSIELTYDALNNGVVVGDLDHINQTVVLEMPQRRRNTSIPDNPVLTYLTKRLFKPNGCYILIGASKGLGFELLKYMAAQGAGVLVAISRSPPSEMAQSEFEQLKIRHNIQIHWVQADVADKMSLAEAFKKIEGLRGRCCIKGVFSGAAVLADAMLRNMTNEKFVEAYRVKVYGTFYLHCQTKDLDLDYFLMHSSLTSILGNIGQTGYGASNAFQDGFAACRRSINLPGQSINWGALSVGMLTSNEAANRHVSSQGILPLEKEEIFYCLEHALLGDICNVSYGKFNWEKMITKEMKDGSPVTARMTFLSIATTILESTNEKNLKRLTSQISVQASEAKTSESTTENYILDAISEQLVMSAGDLDAHKQSALADLGFTSMDTIAVQSKIQQDFAIQIDIEGLSTLDSLTKDLWSKFRALPKNSASNESGSSVPLKSDKGFIEPFGLFRQRLLRDVRNTIDYRGDMTSLLTVEMKNATVSSDELMHTVRRILAQLPHMRTSIQIHPDDTASFLLRSADDCSGQVTSGTSIHPRMMGDMLAYMGHDISRQPPFGFHVHGVHSQHTLYMGMVFHRVLDDSHTLNQFLSMLENALRNSIEPASMVFDEDSANEILQLVDSSVQTSSLFWRGVLPNVIERIEIPSYLLQSTNSDDFDSTVVPVLRNGLSYKSTLNAVTNTEVDLKYFFMSLFQMYIHLFSGATNVVAEMTTDLREILPKKFHNYACNLNNEVLVNSWIDGAYISATTVKEHIKMQCKNVEECVQHGLFPKQSLYEMINDRDVKSDNNIRFTYEFHEEYEPLRPTGSDDMTFKVVHNRPSCPEKNTLKLYVVQRKSDEQLEMYLLSDPGFFSQTGLQLFATRFETFVETCYDNMQYSLTKLFGAFPEEIGNKWSVDNFGTGKRRLSIVKKEGGSLLFQLANDNIVRDVSVNIEETSRCIMFRFLADNKIMKVPFLSIESVNQFNAYKHHGIRVGCREKQEDFQLFTFDQKAIMRIFKQLVEVKHGIQNFDSSTHI